MFFDGLLHTDRLVMVDQQVLWGHMGQYWGPARTDEVKK